MSKFYPHEFVDRGKETQLQVGENLKNILAERGLNAAAEILSRAMRQSGPRLS